MTVLQNWLRLKPPSVYIRQWINTGLKKYDNTSSFCITCTSIEKESPPYSCTQMWWNLFEEHTWELSPPEMKWTVTITETNGWSSTLFWSFLILFI